MKTIYQCECGGAMKLKGSFRAINEAPFLIDGWKQSDFCEKCTDTIHIYQCYECKNIEIIKN